jgi:hypothetical protein
MRQCEAEARSYKSRRDLGGKRGAGTCAGSVAWLCALFVVPVGFIALLIALCPGDRDLRGVGEPLEEWVRSVDAQSAYLKGRIRCQPGLGFESVSHTGEMVPFVMWTSLGQIRIWRAEQGGYVHMGSELGVATVTGPGDGTPPSIGHNFGINALGWIGPLAWFHYLLELEKMHVRTRGNAIAVESLDGVDGRPKLALTVRDRSKAVAATHDLAPSYFASGNVREYVMDRKSRQLESIRVYQHAGGSRVLVFEVDSIKFDERLELGNEITAEVQEIARQSPAASDTVAALSFVADDASPAGSSPRG